MLCIHHRGTDPYFNIATDEFILKHLKEDVFMLWRNDNAIIVGKHQNTLAEINYEYVKANKIHVVRRLSGGGAVYHDLGNLNFSFVKSGKDMKLSDMELFTRPIVDVLQALGVPARFSGRNDITIDGLKISGNAEHIVGNRILHHGTLLFSSEMKNVSEALRIHPLKYRDKAVKSIPKRVTNIADHLPVPITIEAFTDRVMKHIIQSNPQARPYHFSEADLRTIERIKTEKYATREWNYGKVADYGFQKAVKTEAGILEMHLDVEEGRIRKAKIYGDFFNLRDVEEVENALTGVEHEEVALRAVLGRLPVQEYFIDMSLEEILSAMF